ncbi:MAG: hypothetical protein QHH14_03110 [Clostridiales bacterium]|nr:hypothetical protein [Clostridiales bacterium]
MSPNNDAAPGNNLPIEIDYDNIDVGRIMEAIKSKVAQEVGRETDETLTESPGTASGTPQAAETDSLSEQAGRRTGMKRLLLRIMSPFAPLIKLVILPVYEEQRQTLLSLHNTNKRLDALVSMLHEEIEKNNRNREYTKLLHHLVHNIVVEMSKLKIEEETLKTKTRLMEKDFEILTKRERALEKEIFK